MKTQFRLFNYKLIRNNYPKGRALMKMYRVVPQTKIGIASQTRYPMRHAVSLFLI